MNASPRHATAWLLERYAASVVPALAASFLAGSAWAADLDTPAPTSAPAVTPSAATTAPAPAPAPAEIQPFVGTVNADRVYVRSGPGVNYYELGQLTRGDLVDVVGQRGGWYQITPPAGTFCLIAKEFVELDPDGKTGTVKGEFVNVRAGSALQPNSSYAVLGVVKRGAKLTVVGSADKHYKILPPEKITVFIHPQFVRPAPAGTAYVPPTLRIGGVAVATTKPATTQTAEATETAVAATQEATTTGGGAVTTTRPAAGGHEKVIIVAPQPTTTYAPDAYSKFSALNAKTQAEMQKNLAERDLAGLVKAYKDLLETPNLPPSVKQGAEARVTSLEKMVTLQKAVKSDDPNDLASEASRKALNQQWAGVEEQIKEWERSGPLTAEGKLQTSTVVPDKYVLVNPATGRVTAYLNPSREIDLSKLLGSYVGVRGITQPGTDQTVKTVTVRSVTLMAAPGKPAATEPAGQ